MIGMVQAHEMIREALEALGVKRFVLAIHDVSFPSEPDEDIGRGSPYGKGAESFIAFAHGLGFDGIQLGPQGETSAGNASPYDGAVFSKSRLSLPLRALVEHGALVPQSFVDERVARLSADDGRAHYAEAYAAVSEALVASAVTLRERAERGEQAAFSLLGEIDAFAAAHPWLAHDSRFEAFAALHGTEDFRTWPGDDRDPSDTRAREAMSLQEDEVLAFRLAQVLLAKEHEALRGRMEALGMRLYGDLQVGLSLRDRWTRDALFMRGYALGAPPSRTNPEGQPWGYAVYDPKQYRPAFAAGGEGEVARFFRARVEKMLSEFDGIRIDHPHGLVCPWVYDAGAADPMDAVVHGARLFETPSPSAGAVRHPALAELAIVRPDQIDEDVPAYDDDHVRSLEEDQVREYATLFDIVIESARAAGRSRHDILCEVLSTCPEPLARVMARDGLGRFRVTQKASLVDPADGYRGENASPRDWTMIGNHDTAPLGRVVARWSREGTLAARAEYLATRLEPDPAERPRFARWLLEKPGRLETAIFAELFVGPASNVLVFWADLFGERDVYNTPGLVSTENWTMRVPRDFGAIYTERARAGQALDVAAALAMALRARALRPDLERALGAGAES